MADNAEDKEGGGLLGGLGNFAKRIKDEITVEDDGGAKPVAKKGAKKDPAFQAGGFLSSAPAPVPTEPLPPLSGAAVPFSPTVVPFSATTPVNPVADEATLNAIRDAVYTQVGGRQSRFVTFLRIWEKMGSSKPASEVLSIMQISDEIVTISDILGDLAVHNEILARTTQEADEGYQQAVSAKLGGNDTEVQKLQQQNADAQAEITRHQQETAERNSRIGVLQQARAQDEASLSAIHNNALNALASVRAQMATVSQLLQQP